LLEFVFKFKHIFGLQFYDGYGSINCVNVKHAWFDQTGSV